MNSLSSDDNNKAITSIAGLDADIGEDQIVFAEEIAEVDETDCTAVKQQAWRMLIVDDDQYVHVTTRFALDDFEFQGRRLELLSAYSGTEAFQLLQKTDDVALVLIDVVMETDDAGLVLTRRIREELNNQLVRIVLRTGQSGLAPEAEVIAEYDINDYKNKSELTRQTLRTTVTAALRAYKSLVTLEQTILERTREIVLLGDMGRQITASLDLLSIQETLYQHMQKLIVGNVFGIGLVDWDRRVIEFDFVVDRGRKLRPYQRSLDVKEQPATQCVLTASDLWINELAIDTRQLDSVVKMDGSPEQILLEDGSLSSLARSALYAPIMLHGKVMGVIAVQSDSSHAFNANHLTILHSLGAYAAVAISNAFAHSKLAKAHQHLQETQSQLIQAEKMASLGLLIANVAHEINTPIGVVKASGENINSSLEYILINLPRLFQVLSIPDQELFILLIAQSNKCPGVLSSREERVIVRSVTAQLASMNVSNAHHVASILVELWAQNSIDDFKTLLEHPDRDSILNLARNLAIVINSTGNINNAVQRIAKIVFALKSYAHVDNSGEMCEVDLREHIEIVLTIYQNQLKQGTDLVRLYEDVPLIFCFPDELNQVWTNLIQNALQAMNHKGTLTIGIRREAEMVVLSISDTGCGIPGVNQEKIFEPFFTTKAIGEGSGLGLDIVRKIIDKHAGKIQVKSEVGVGTTFFISLPIQQNGS